MSRKKFDPSVIAGATPSGSLAPLDFMRPMEAEATINQARETTAHEPAKAPTPLAATPEVEDLPMPPSRQTQLRVLLAARVTPELAERVERFHRDKNVDKQDI